MDELKIIALELLEKYQKAQTSVIWEYSGSIQAEIKQLECECEGYRERIEVACSG